MAWEHQREVRKTLQTIVPGPWLGTAVSHLPEKGPGRNAPARALRQPPAGPAPAPPDDSIL